MIIKNDTYAPILVLRTKLHFLLYMLGMEKLLTGKLTMRQKQLFPWPTCFVLQVTLFYKPNVPTKELSACCLRYYNTY